MYSRSEDHSPVLTAGTPLQRIHPPILSVADDDQLVDTVIYTRQAGTSSEIVVLAVPATCSLRVRAGTSARPARYGGFGQTRERRGRRFDWRCGSGARVRSSIFRVRRQSPDQTQSIVRYARQQSPRRAAATGSVDGCESRRPSKFRDVVGMSLEGVSWSFIINPENKDRLVISATREDVVV